MKQKTDAEKRELKDVRRHYEITVASRRVQQTGKCASGCGKPVKTERMTCGDLDCLRKWLQIGELCTNCRRHYYHTTPDNFCSIVCRNQHEHKLQQVKEI